MKTAQMQARFQTLLDEHKKIVYKISNSYCANRDDRDDLAQEIIVQLWRSFGTFDERLQFSTWMYRVALNVAISFSRSESASAQRVVSAGERLLETSDETRHEPEDLILLNQFIQKLDPLNKALILLYLEGYDYREIADVLGITETNVATKISRLKSTMKQHFSTPGAT